MDYLALKTRQLNAHELKEIKENSDNKRDPELHDIWQSKFPITMCQEFVASGFIACWNNKFVDTLSLYERCIKSNPDPFHTGDAWDVIRCLHENSGYWRSIEDYDKYLKTHYHKNIKKWPPKVPNPLYDMSLFCRIQKKE